MGKSVFWFNEKLKVDKKPMHLKEWCKNNIYLVNSLLDEEGNIMTYEQFKNIYAIRTNFLEFLGVTQAVKKMMRDFNIDHPIKEQEPIVPLHILPLINSKTDKKFLYRILNFNNDKPTGQKKWDNQFEISQEEWKKIHKNVFKNTKDSKLQWLQYRINHKILTTNTFLKIIKKSDNDLCSFCLEERESLEHVMHDCEKVSTFLRNVQSWFCDNFTFNIRTDKKTFILGCSESEMVNFINYHLKHFIYFTKCKGNCLSLNRFKVFWINVYKVEKQIAWKNNCTNQFEKKWKLFESLKTQVS